MLGATLRVPMRKHLRRMLSRLDQLPPSPERDRAIELAKFVSSHWDQYASHEARKTQLLGCALIVGEVEHLARLDEQLARDRMRVHRQSAAGKNKPEPDWHAKCVSAAHALLATDTPKRNLTGKLTLRFGKDRKAIDAVLKKAGVK